MLSNLKRGYYDDSRHLLYSLLNTQSDMKPERSIKELLIILRDNLEKEFKSDPNNGGMCSVIHELRDNDEISEDEWGKLLIYLKNNKPLIADKRKIMYKDQFDSNGFMLEDHWWKPKSIKPRKNWINKQIDKL